MSKFIFDAEFLFHQQTKSKWSKDKVNLIDQEWILWKDWKINFDIINSDERMSLNFSISKAIPIWIENWGTLMYKIHDHFSKPQNKIILIQVYNSHYK